MKTFTLIYFYQKYIFIIFLVLTVVCKFYVLLWPFIFANGCIQCISVGVLCVFSHCVEMHSGNTISFLLKSDGIFITWYTVTLINAKQL